MSRILLYFTKLAELSVYFEPLCSEQTFYILIQLNLGNLGTLLEDCVQFKLRKLGNPIGRLCTVLT